MRHLISIKTPLTNPHLSPPHLSPFSVTPKIYGPYGVFRNNDLLKFSLTAFLIADAMLTIFRIIIYQVADSPALTHIHSGIAIPKIILPSVILILFFIWINRTCKNAWLLDPPKMKTTPGLAVAYFFIPLLNLWKPLTTMIELRNASYGRNDKLTTTLPLWWILCLLIAFLSLFHLVSYLPDNSKDLLTVVKKLNIVAQPLRVILDYLTISIILGITLAQKKRAAAWKP